MKLPMSGLKGTLQARLMEAISADGMRDMSDGESKSDSSSQEWKVKKIIGRRVTTQLVEEMTFDVVEYEVQWDFPDPDDPSVDEVTWETESNFDHAHDALHEYLASQPKEPGCEFGHIRGVCRCAQPLIHAGQDESIFKAYQKSSFQWVVQGIRGLRKTTDGPDLVKWCLASKTRFADMGIH
ncbi:MAG: hypothetical protein SGPRY_008563 [Prymnesium sp.]